jgi:transitional endoplasmic reticulum ATPase
LYSKGDKIAGRFEVLFGIHQTTYGWSYRVKDLLDGKVYMLKIYQKDSLKPYHFTAEGDLLEAIIHKGLKHPNLARYVLHDSFEYKGVQLIYYVVGFISGETLHERMEREGEPNQIFALNFFRGVLDAVAHLHEQQIPVLHCDITPQNIMMDLSDNQLSPVLIDFGLARYVESEFSAYNQTQPSVYYCAPELLEGEPSVQSDIFSLGALLYCLLMGYFPWHGGITNSDIHSNSFVSDLLLSRKKKLRFSSLEHIDDHMKSVIIKCLLPSQKTRFQSVHELRSALDKENILTLEDVQVQERQQILKRSPGEGFKKIAGMGELKEMISREVIDPLLHPEKNKDYGLEPPNGVLFYGPPGCGKTFFAECLADEVGFNFLKVKPSDVASPYVHGGQEKISQLFKEAKDNAPTILFLDEMDAMIPRRDGSVSHHYESEVNEWLVQINNCSQNEVFIIGATNRINKIDTAVLRSGRFDRKIHIPLPDKECRQALFDLNLGKRPKVLAVDLNVEDLAEKTEGFVCSDITLIVNDSARLAAKNGVQIDNAILHEVISATSPSVNEKELKEYNNEKLSEEKRTTIGFRMPSQREKTNEDQEKIKKLEREMNRAAAKEDFNKAAELQAEIEKLKNKQ